MAQLDNQISILLFTLLSVCSSELSVQNYFNRIFTFDDISPNPAEVVQISKDSFVINTLTNVDGLRSSSIISYDALLDNSDRYDLVGIEPNRRSLLKIKNYYYLYATNQNEENDSLTLIKMNQQFEILDQTNFSSPDDLMHQAKVLEINNSIYGASAYDPNGDQTRLTHFKKIDTLGNVLWSENYFGDLRSKGDSDYTVTPDHHILSSNVIRFDVFNTFPQVVKMDTLGNVIWRYDHDEETESVSSPLVLLSNGEIIFGQAIDLSINEFLLKFIWLDQDGYYVKEKLLIPYEQFESFGYANFVEGKGDYFFGHGSYRENAPDSSNQEWYGLITKFDNEGEVIWTHRYKHPDYTLNGDIYSFNDLIEEESGDLVVLGQITRFSDVSAFKVWLFRVDSTGCPDPAYCDEFINFTSTKEKSIPYEDLNLFPNPASQRMYIDLPQSAQSGTLEIISSVGNVIKTKNIYRDPSPIGIDVVDLPSGTYYARFRSSETAMRYRGLFLKID